MYICKKLQTIIGKLSSKTRYCYSKFVSSKTATIRINQTISMYSTFWSAYLSVFFPNLIFIQAYLYLISLNIPTQYIRYIAVFVAFILAIFLYLLIRQCAEVVKLNLKISKQNRAFYLISQKYFKMGAMRLLRV